MTVTPISEYAHAQIEPVLQADPTGLTTALVTAATVAEEPVFALVEDPGAATYLEPAVAPAAWLPWLARLTGGQLTITMTEAQRRAEVASPNARNFGAPGRVLAAARAFLDQPARIVGVRRSHPDFPGTDRPGDYTLIVHPGDVPDGAEPLLEAAAQAQAWVGLYVHVVYESGRTWADLVAEADTWQDAMDLYPTWQDAIDGP